MKYFFIGAIIFVALALGLGMYFSGSPSHARAERLDEIRVSHLANIQNSVVNFYTRTGKLPLTMSEIVQQEQTNFYTDPETQVLYEYTKNTETQFSLCATFTFKSMSPDDRLYPDFYTAPAAPGIIGNTNWNHEAGHVCFDRTIDPKFITPSGVPVMPIQKSGM